MAANDPFDLKFTSREVTAWGGLALLKRMLDGLDFKAALRDGLGILLRDVAVAQGQAHHAGIFALGQGVGLGLSVSREIAREHGGDLSLKGDGDGDGAGAVQFSLLLPL